MQRIYDFLTNKRYMLITLISLFLVTILFYYFQFDFDITKNNSNSISKESKVTLKELNLKNVEVTYLSAIVNPTDDYEILKKVTTVFKQFKKYNKNIKYKIIDLSTNPEELNNYEYIDTRGTILIKHNDKTVFLPSQVLSQKYDNTLSIVIEKVLIDELLKLKSDANYNIYYTNTHGERFETDDYSDFRMILNSMGYKFIPLNLNESNLNNINHLFIIAPNNDFTLDEISKIENLVSTGTSLFFSLKSDRYNVPGAFLNLKGLTKKYGVSIDDSVIVDQIQDTKLIGVYENLADTEKYIEEINSIVYMPFSRKIKIVESDVFTPLPILSSGELSSHKNDGKYSSFPIVLRMKNETSKVVISATPELINNNNIKDNEKFVIFLFRWLDKFNSNLDIEPFLYTEYITNPNELKPSLIFGIIKIIIPCIVLFFGIENKLKRETSVKKIKLKKKIIIKKKKNVKKDSN